MTRNVERRQEIDPAAVEAARRVSPEAFLRARYGADLTAYRNGRSISVDKVLRSDRKQDGHWISCDWYGGGIGDNISLVRRETGIGFVAAIELLAGDAMRDVAPAPPREPVREQPLRPRVPYLAEVPEGRGYLVKRGLSKQTILAAERCGALRYCRGAVIFLGRDHESPTGEIRLAAMRYLESRLGENGKPMNKRDLAGSDKSFPMWLTGDPGLVAVVEGGVNALAVRDLYRDESGREPTVIVTGGVGVRQWVTDNAPLMALLQGAEQVVIVAENEVDEDGLPDPIKQGRTDVLRNKLSQAIAEVREGEVPETRYPPQGAKDAADWLVLTRMPARREVAVDDPSEAPVPGLR